MQRSSSSANNNVNVDQFKYLQSLLPSNAAPLIENLRFGDVQNWECTLRVGLASESECLKWLSDFSGKSKTEWKVRNATDVKGSNWAATYQCKKEAAGCAAKIVFRLDKEANSIRERENPCKIHISFYHSHHNHSTAASNVTSSTVTSSSHNGGGHSASASSSSSSSSTFNKHDIPAHLKEPFEGYFQPKTASAAMQPVALSEVQPQSSPSGGRAVILTEQEKVQNRAFQQQQKFEAVVNILRNMLKRGDSGSASVIRFVDTAKKLASFTSSSTSLLEAALNDFGSGLEDKIRQHQQRQWQQQFQQERERQRRQQEEDLMRKRKSGIKSQVLPGEIDPLTGKRRKRSRCGTCEGCINRDKTQDCRQCRNCLDQKRYGGPGRLKKACVRRSCAVMADQECSSSNNNNNSSHSSSTSPNSNSNGGSSSVALPLHPVPVSMTTAFSVWPTAAQHAAAALQFQQQQHAAAAISFPYANPYSTAMNNNNNNNSNNNHEANNSLSAQLEAITAEAARHHGLE